MTSSRRVPARSRGWIAGVARVVAVAVLLLAAQSSLSPATARYHYDGQVAASFAVGMPVVSAHDVGTCRVAASSSDSRHVYDPQHDPALANTLPVSRFFAPNTALNLSGIRFSQTSVSNVDEIAASMRANGWVGDSIDVVRMPDGGLTTVDNSRVLAAHQAEINVEVRVHAFDDLLPSGSVGRFTTPKGGAPTSWGEAVLNRIGAQNAPFRNRWPTGSPFTGWDGL